MLPNYLRTYSSALCQIRALEKPFKKWKHGYSVPNCKSWFWMHAFDWPEQSLTLKIYIQYSMYFACNNALCSAVLTILLGDVFLSFLHTFEPWRRHLRIVTRAKGSQKSEFYMLAFDWLEQTDKIGCNIFPARMTCAELWRQIVWEHFPQLCVKFQPWRRQLGNMFKTTPYF